MIRRPVLALAALAAVVLLAGVLVVTRSAAGSPGRSAAARQSAALGPAAPSPLFAGRLLVYANNPLTSAQLRAVRAVSDHVVAVALHEENVASGSRRFPDIPVLTMVVDPSAYATAVGRPGLADPLARGAVLAATEARLRHLGVGGTVRFSDGRRIPVTAVVDDHVLGGNEMSLPAAVSRRPGTGYDYLLVAGGADRTATDRAIRRALPATKLRVRSSTDNGYVSSADRVLTQLQVKARFGEFAMRRTGRTTFEPDPRWSDRYLVTTRVPQLGRVTCNRVLLPHLTAAMKEITRRGLGATVHTADFQYQGGCWNPNIVPGDNGTISRHSWGLAVDINVDTNGFGERPRQDARLVSVMAAHGFTWGGRWLTPDAMHFEFAPPPGR